MFSAVSSGIRRRRLPQLGLLAARRGSGQRSLFCTRVIVPRRWVGEMAACAAVQARPTASKRTARSIVNSKGHCHVGIINGSIRARKRAVKRAMRIGATISGADPTIIQTREPGVIGTERVATPDGTPVPVKLGMIGAISMDTGYPGIIGACAATSDAAQVPRAVKRAMRIGAIIRGAAPAIIQTREPGIIGAG